MPSGNASAALALYRLGLLIGCRRFTEVAERALQSVADNVNQTPLHAAGFVALLEAVQHPPLQIIVRGDANAWQAWREQLLPRLRPSQSIYFIANDALELPPQLAEKIAGEKTCAWVCEGFSCRQPVFEIEPLLRLIDE